MAARCSGTLVRAFCVSAIFFNGTLAAFPELPALPVQELPLLEPAGELGESILYKSPAAATVDAPFLFGPEWMTCTAEGRLRIENMPAWAWFDPAQGTLEGTPSASDVGTYSDIRILLIEGETSASVASFSVEVAVARGTATPVLTWLAPMVNEDGSLLTNLAGFRVYSRSSPYDAWQITEIDDPASGSYLFEALAAGPHYFAISAVNAEGVESELSRTVSTVVQP